MMPLKVVKLVSRFPDECYRRAAKMLDRLSHFGVKHNCRLTVFYPFLAIARACSKVASATSVTVPVSSAKSLVGSESRRAFAAQAVPPRSLQEANLPSVVDRAQLASACAV
jgi:hypothetical protein